LHLLNVGKKTPQEEDCICILNGLLVKRIKREESECSEPESNATDNETKTDQELVKIKDFRKKFPFKQTYD
jgi:hypothetical protein